MDAFESDMTETEALKINALIVGHFMHSEGFAPDKPEPINHLLLSDMIKASRIVANIRSGHGKGIPMYCDDRYIAALYAACHYQNSETPVAIYGNKRIDVRTLGQPAGT